MSKSLTATKRRSLATELVCPLRRAADSTACGGKAAGLAHLLTQGFPVPDGFVVTAAAFRLFLAENALDNSAIILNPHDPQALRQTAATMRERVLAATIPVEVWEAIQEQLASTLVGATLVVRSSALGEDSAAASFAGQLDTVLDVDSDTALQTALLTCWASYWSERVVFYQRSRGVPLTGMAVIIQEQIQSRVSGVLFTRAPQLSGQDDDAMLIEYCAGYGEGLVSGRIDPGRIAISRGNPRIQRLALAEGSASLSDAVVRQLANAGQALEETCGAPQDIEWTLDQDERLHLLQTRPITTWTPGAARVAWSNANVNENFPEPISPLLYSIAATGYYHYFRNLGKAFGIARGRIQSMEHALRHLIGVHGGRMYYNLSNIHAVLRAAPFGDHLVRFFNQFVGVEQSTEKLQGATSRFRLTELVELAVIGLKTAWQFLFLPRRVAVFERTANLFAGRTEPAELGKRSPRELLDAFRGFLNIRCHHWTNAALADAAAMIGYGLLQGLLRRQFPDAELATLHNTLLKGLANVISGEPVRQLWELSRQVHADPALHELFADTDGEHLLEQIRSRPEFHTFRAAFERYLDQWGFRCSGELMLTTPTFQENPVPLVEIVRAYVTRDGTSPVELLQQQGDERRALTARVLETLSRRRLIPGLLWPTRATLLRAVLAWTQRAIAWRERARLKQALLYSRCRRIVLALGQHLVRQGQLDEPDDIFCLTYLEIDDLLSGCAMFPGQVRDLIRLRQAGRADLASLSPPDAFELPEGSYWSGTSRESPTAASGESEEAVASDELRGVGACGGDVQGPAAVLCDVAQIDRLHEGDILVTKQTDPGWAPVFFLIRGLVMERGGMLSHGAILAREFGLPTVVGVPGASRRIAPGQQVAIQGDRGVVRLS